MNFKINNRDWKIIELSQEEMRNVIKNYKYDGEPKEGKYFGLTYIDSQVIYIDKDLCNISACSHDIINKIINDYFEGK